MYQQAKHTGLLAAFTALSALAMVLAGESALAAAPKSGRQSYTSSNMRCLVGNDFYAVNFTAIQEGRNQGGRNNFEKYCQEIPSLGKTYLSIDLLDRDVRKMPIALRVVEEEFSEDDGRPPKEKRILARSPAKLYPNGTADIPADIAQPGHYALIATIGEEAISEDDRLRIPFTVALQGAAKVNWLGRFTGVLVIAFFGTTTWIGFRAYRAYHPKKADGAAAPATPAAGAEAEAG